MVIEREIIYSEGGARFERNFEIFLKFVLPLIHKTAKAISSATQRVFPSWIDNKKVIKQ